MSQDSYYKNHPYETEFKALVKLVSLENKSLVYSLVASSKNQKQRKKFLQKAISTLQKNSYSEETILTSFISLSSYPYRFLEKALATNLWRFVLIAQFNLDLAKVVKKEDVEEVGRALEYRSVHSLNNCYKKYPFEEFKNITHESNGVIKNYSMDMSKIPYKDVFLVPMETRLEFMEVGEALKSCTGGATHWENVRDLKALRFKILRNETIIGTLLYSANTGKVYGFEKDYTNYSESTIKDMTRTVSPHIKNPSVVSLELFKYETHGWGKGTPSL